MTSRQVKHPFISVSLRLTTSQQVKHPVSSSLRLRLLLFTFVVLVSIMSSAMANDDATTSNSETSQTCVTNNNNHDGRQAPNVIDPDGRINIYDPLTDKMQQIPMSYTASWPTYVLYADRNNRKKDHLIRVPLDNDGFVNPISFQSLWIPHDLDYPHLRLCLGLHIRDGVIRHFMPGVDLSFERKHHNRGLSSYVRATQWVNFSASDWDKFDLVVMKRKLKAGPRSPLEVVATSPVRPFLDRAIEYITSNAPDEWKEGSHIVNVVFDDDAEQVLECPKVGYQLIVDLNSEGAVAPRGQLKINVSAVMAGSKSEHLPEAYTSLFSNKKFQRHSYFQYQQRKDASQEKMKAQASDAVKAARDRD